MSTATTMHAHTPGSYSISLMLHGAIVAAILLTAHAFNDARKNTGPKIIELVAGPGDDYMALVAPALGAPDAPAVPGIAFPPPAAPLAAPPSLPPPPPAPPPITATPAPNPIVPVAPDALILPPPKTIPKTPPKPKTTTPITKADFDKQNADKNRNMPSNKPAPPRQPGGTVKPITPPKIGQGLSKGVLGGAGAASGAGGTALTAAERDQMDGYFSLLAQRIREAQQKPEGLSSELVVRIEFQVSASGAIGAVKIIRSSGNRAFDDSVLKAIRTVRSIGARPDGKSDAKTADFRMREEE